MNLYINEDKTIKPCVFVGVLTMFAAALMTIFVTLIGYGGSIYPFVVRHDNWLQFTVMFSIGLALFAIGMIPGIKQRKLKVI